MSSNAHEVSEGDTVRFRKKGIKKGTVSNVYRGGIGPDVMVKYESRTGASRSSGIESGDIIEVVERSRDTDTERSGGSA